MYAIKTDSIGKPVAGFERVPYGTTTTPSGYDFLSDTNPAGMVVSEDGVSLREPTATELDAINNPVPKVVSRAQARIALHGAGLLSQVEALIADPATDPVMVIAYNDAQEFNRNSPTLAALATALGLTDADLDDLFRAAAAVEL